MSEWTSSNDDASFALMNRKTVLTTTGAGIEAATRYGQGQVAYCTDVLGNGRKERGHFYVTDYTNATWQRVFDNVLYPVNWGQFGPYSSTYANCVEGVLKIASTSGTVALQAADPNLGRCVRFTAASGAGNTSGINLGQQCWDRQFNPSWHCRLRVQEVTNNRYYFGFTTNTSVLGNTDDPLNGVGGIMIGRRSTDTNLFWLHNDGVGSTVGDDTGVTATTNSMFVHIFADDGNAKYICSVETPSQEATTEISTNIPSSTSTQSWQLTYINNASGARSFELFQCLISSQR